MLLLLSFASESSKRLGCPGGPRSVVIGSRTGLSAIRATAAGYRPEYLYLAAHVVIDHLADEHDAVVTGVGGLQALEAGVVRLYGVVWLRLAFSGGWWVR